MRCDVAIIGGGPIGMCTGLALNALGYDILIAEKRSREALGKDRRILALSQGSRLILDRLGVWSHLSQVTSIMDIMVTDARQPTRVALGAAECGVPALGYVTTFTHLEEALLQALSEKAGIAIHHDCTAHIASTEGASARVQLTDSQQTTEIETTLVVHAEGGAASATELASRRKDYRQWGIVAQVWTSPGASHTAYEHFTSQGPIAMLPFEDHFALVWTIPAQEHEQVMALDDDGFCQRLGQALGSSCGAILRVGPRAGFPLSMHMLRNTTQHRSVRVGNAAQQLHPVAAQGFNLGLRDVWELQESLWNRPADPGARVPLVRYEKQRQADRNTSVWLTDSLIELFGSTNLLARAARRAALDTLAASKPLRSLFAHRMMFGSR